MGRFLEPPLYIGVIMARLRLVGISPVFREALYSSWRGWAMLLLHCFRSIAANSSGSPEEFFEIVFIASMMSSLVILMSDSVFAEVFVYFITMMQMKIMAKNFLLVKKL